MKSTAHEAIKMAREILGDVATGVRKDLHTKTDDEALAEYEVAYRGNPRALLTKAARGAPGKSPLVEAHNYETEMEAMHRARMQKRIRPRHVRAAKKKEGK
jgi:hypothetical protein